jgi:hypothetical protein
MDGYTGMAIALPKNWYGIPGMVNKSIPRPQVLPWQLVWPYVRPYVRTYVTYVRTYNVTGMSQLSDWKSTENHVYYQWYHNGTMVHVYTYTCMAIRTGTRTRVRTYHVMSQLSDWKRAHMCTENHVCIRVRKCVSQKRLEIQALRCNGDTIVGVVSIEDLQLRFQLDSDVCSAPPQSSQACGPARAPAPASPPLGRSQW